MTPRRKPMNVVSTKTTIRTISNQSTGLPLSLLKLS